MTQTPSPNAASPGSAPTLASLLERLGRVSPDRVRAQPPPGTAMEQDVVRARDTDRGLCELVDGVLVDKAMGYVESIVAGALIEALRRFVRAQDLGVVAGESGMLRLAPGLVRIPDVSVIRWESFPQRQVPREPLPSVAPDVAVEVLSQRNTPEEMARKVQEYFDSGAELVWLIDPRSRSAEVFTAPDRSHTVHEHQSLGGEPVLPGFREELKTLFADLDRS